jgi:hypothetical protein
MKKIRHIVENISETKLDKNTVHILYLYIYLSIILCYNLLFSYDHSKYKVGIFTGCIYVQSIFILIDLSIKCAFYLTFCQNSQFIEKNVKRENSDF